MSWCLPKSAITSSRSSSSRSKAACSLRISSWYELRSFSICFSTSSTVSSIFLGHPYASHLSLNCWSGSWKLNSSSTSNCASISSITLRISSVCLGISPINSSSSATSSIVTALTLSLACTSLYSAITFLLLAAAFSAMSDMIMRSSVSYFCSRALLIASVLTWNMPRLITLGMMSAIAAFSLSLSSISALSSASEGSFSSYVRMYSVRSRFMTSR
mmetsp:Transcript_27967/g.68256  ORF Transcript_27967/g.68256 Transcript_27967/m.68256 type:complete len:216 (+) Transcript_27967:836-1483(+)